MKEENDRRNLISSSDAEKKVAAEEQDKVARRICFWAEKVKMERKRRRLISMLIAAEFYRVNNGLEFYEEIKDEIKEDIKEESRQTHEALYGPCRVIVVGSDRDGNGPRKGTIVCWDTIKLHLRVRMDSDSTDQRPRLVRPETLDMETPGQQSAETNVKQYPVSFKFRDGSTEGGEDIRFQFNLKRRYIDELESKGGTSAALKEFREERDASSNRLDVKQEERIEKAATTEDRDRGRLAPKSQQQQQQLKSMALMEQTSCAVTCVHGFSTSQDCSGVHEFLKLFCKECKFKADGITLEQQCIQSAIDISYASHGRIWSNSNDMEIAISLMLYFGTQDILNGDVANARAIATVANFLEQWVAMALCKSQYDWYWPKIHELYNADEHTLVSFFRNRISCTCLDDKHRRVRSIKKMGICCNPRCSLPERKLERSGMESCEQCRLVHYCSRKCQKNDWKRHKEACLVVAAKINVFDAQVAQCQSAYDDACRTSVRLEPSVWLQQKKAICMNKKYVESQAKKYFEAGVTQAETHEQVRAQVKAELEAEMKQIENDFNVAEVRRTKAWNALLAAKKPKVDYSKTRGQEVGQKRRITFD